MIAEVHDECTAGSISVSSSPLTLKLGDRVKVPITVTNRNGRVLDGRSVTGGGSFFNWSLNQDSVYASSPTNGAEPGGLSILASQQVPLGTLSVTVLPFPFPGRVTTILYSYYLWDRTVDQPEDPGNPPRGIPPAPINPPTWDGSPTSCTDTITTSAYHATSDWVRHCQRKIILTIPANPMPVSYRLQVGLFGYPDGVLSMGGGSDVLLPPQAARVDTLEVCGPEYCLRGVVVQTLNSGRGLMTSDTTCIVTDLPCPGGGTTPAPASIGQGTSRSLQPNSPGQPLAPQPLVSPLKQRRRL